MIELINCEAAVRYILIPGHVVSDSKRESNVEACEIVNADVAAVTKAANPNLIMANNGMRAKSSQDVHYFTLYLKLVLLWRPSVGSQLQLQHLPIHQAPIEFLRRFQSLAMADVVSLRSQHYG